MEISFRHNGQWYNQCYAWVPTKVTSGTWIWFSVYYSKETKKNGWVTLTPFEFLLESSKS